MRRVAWAVGAYLFTTFLVGSAVAVGSRMAASAQMAEQSAAQRLLNAASQSDAQAYQAVTEDGYAYDRERPSNVAFFPLYPLLARAFQRVTPLSGPVALLLVSHLSIVLAFVALLAYACRRCPDTRTWSALWSVLGFGLFPTTFFWRMPYSESLFVLLCLLALLGMRRQCGLTLVALIVGAATAARPVGVALLPPLLLDIWRRSPSNAVAFVRSSYLLPLALSGILAYAVFLGVRFGNPLAFAQTQENWRKRPPAPVAEKALSLASWEPLWSVYVPGSPCHWRRAGDSDNPLFSLAFANPVFFLATAGLLAIGGWKGWLNAQELLLGIGLLLIPYVTRGYEMCMLSQGRYASAVVPAYLVLGNLLARLPTVVAAGVLGVFAVFLAVYSALFAAGRMLI